MSEYGGLEALRRALAGAPGPHLDDGQLAEIVTAEIGGEAVESKFAPQLAHIESCEQCASAYYELVELMLEAEAEMSRAAEAVSPLEVYAALLQRQLAQGRHTADVASDRLARQVAKALPLYFRDTPESAQDVTPELAGALLAEALGEEQAASELVRRLTEALRNQLSALALYLQSVADSIWGQALHVALQANEVCTVMRLAQGPVEMPNAFYLSSELQMAEPAPAYDAPSNRWTLLQEQIIAPGTLKVTVQAERTSELACELQVQLQSPAEAETGSYRIRLRYGGRHLCAVNDATGRARLGPVPIGALAQAAIDVEATNTAQS